MKHAANSTGLKAALMCLAPPGAMMLSCATAGAASVGDVEVTGGWIYVDPRSESGPLAVTQIGPMPVYLPQPGTGVKVSSTQTAAFTLAMAVSESFWLQVILGIPVDQELRGTGSLESVGVIGKGQQLSPALLLKYRFGQEADRIWPFVSAGFNYTTYRKSRITNDAFRQATYGPNATTTVDATSSFSPVVNVGADFRMTDRWFLNASVAYTPIKSTLSVTADNTALGVPVKSSVDVKLNSISFGLNLGYRF